MFHREDVLVDGYIQILKWNKVLFTELNFPVFLHLNEFWTLPHSEQLFSLIYWLYSTT